MATASATRQVSDRIPPTLAALPLRIIQTATGNEVEFEEEVSLPGGLGTKILPTRLHRWSAISWGRLEKPVCTIMEMFREMERRVGHLLHENEQLRGQLAQTQSDKESLERSMVIANRDKKGKVEHESTGNAGRSSSRTGPASGAKGG